MYFRTEKLLHIGAGECEIQEPANWIITRDEIAA
jgi:hypothetical protein